MMRRVRYGLGVLLAVCVALRVLAWLVTPAIPILTAAFVIVTVFVIGLTWRRQL